MPTGDNIYQWSHFSTVGTGGTSTGQFNVSDYYSSASACISDALSQSVGVVLLAGIYDLTTPLIFNGAGRVLVLGPGAVLRNCSSGSTGFAAISGERNSIHCDGGKLQVSNWVNSQKVINITSGGNLFKSRDLFVDVTTTAGNNSTPMDILSATGVVDPNIKDFVCSPNTGIRPVNMTSLSGLTLRGTRIRTIATAFASPRACYEAIRITGCRWPHIIDTEILGLGTLSTAEMNEVIVVKGDPNATVSQGDFTGLVLDDFTIEQCASPKLISLLGVVGFGVTDGRLSNPLGAIATRGEAALFIDSEDGHTSVGNSEANICGAGKIADVTFESAAVSTGNALYLRNGKKIDINDCHIHMPSGGAQSLFLFNTKEARSIKVRDTRFDGDPSITNWGVALECVNVESGDAPIVPMTIQDVSIRDNEGTGLRYGVCPSREPFFSGATLAAGSTYDDGSLYVTTSYGSAQAQPLTDSTGVTAPTLGTVMNVPTVSTIVGTASGSANFAASIVAAVINHITQGAGNFNITLTHNGGSPAGDGTIDAVDGTAATFNAAIQEIEKKLNEFVTSATTVAGNILLRKAFVNGAHTAGAIQKLIDNSTGVASAAGIVGPISDATSSKNAIATMAQAVGINTTTLGMLDYLTFNSNVCTVHAQGT